MNPEQLLWQGVVHQAIVDAFSESENPEEQRARVAADKWLRDCRKDMRMVCDLAGIDPLFLSDMYKSGRIDFRAYKGTRKSARQQEAAE